MSFYEIVVIIIIIIIGLCLYCSCLADLVFMTNELSFYFKEGFFLFTWLWLEFFLAGSGHNILWYSCCQMISFPIGFIIF